MNDHEFSELEEMTERATRLANYLQKLWKEQTGTNYVLPLRVSFTDADDLERETKDRR